MSEELPLWWRTLRAASVDQAVPAEYRSAIGEALGALNTAANVTWGDNDIEDSILALGRALGVS